MGVLPPLTCPPFSLVAPALARELLSVKHVDDLLISSANAENIFNVLSRVPRASITDLAKFP